jgi:NAD+ synthase (glutamine-hydrolysing)
VIVGFIDQDKNKIGPDGTHIRYNSAALIYQHQLIKVQDKTLLPDYDVFFENRYFAPARERSVVEFKGLKIGVEICEDLWDENYSTKVSEELVNQGANILINISGSPFYINKGFDRQRLIMKKTSVFKLPFIYVNTIGVQDGYDGEIVFDGQSMVFDSGSKLVYVGKKFEEEIFFIELDKLANEGYSRSTLLNNVEEELLSALTLAIKRYFNKTNFKKAFIGISGGIDSALVATIATFALGKENVVGVCMPSLFSSRGSIEDSIELAKNLGIQYEILNINKIFRGFQNLLKEQFNGLNSDLTEENLQARIRGVLLMAHANKFGGLVISTANKTETALGYTTLYGDMCGAIAPLADIDKLRVYDLANYINKKNEIIPRKIIKKIPSAELRDNQTDEDSLGATYKVIVPLVNSIIENLKTENELSKQYPKNIVKKIFNLINMNEYKRRQSPPSVKVTKKTFGIGRRMPIAHKFIN